MIGTAIDNKHRLEVFLLKALRVVWDRMGQIGKRGIIKIGGEGGSRTCNLSY